MYIMVLLLRCCLLRNFSLTTLTMRGENLTRPEPEIRESRADLRLPFFTSGFE